MKKKGMNAMETVFLMFVLIIVVVVTVQMFTRFSSATKEKLGSELSDFEKHSGYEKAIDTCNSLCTQYTANRRSFTALVNYCTGKVAVDINGNDIIDSSEPRVSDIGNAMVVAPSIGYVVCEKNVYCPQLTKCEDLSMKECISRMCAYYKQKYRDEGYANTNEEAADMATPLVKQNYAKGDCDIDGIVNSDEASEYGIPKINWYESLVQDLDCASLLGYREALPDCNDLECDQKISNFDTCDPPNQLCKAPALFSDGTVEYCCIHGQ